MSAIKLKSCPKVYIHETHRSKFPEDTLHFVEGMRNLLGMRDFRDATGAGPHRHPRLHLLAPPAR